MQVTHQGTVDPEIGEALQTVYVLADDAETSTMTAAAFRCQAVLWAVLRRANERKWVKAELVKRKRRDLLTAARARKEKVREQDITHEEIGITTGMLKLEAEIRADAQMAGEDPDTCMDRLRAEVTQDETPEAA